MKLLLLSLATLASAFAQSADKPVTYKSPAGVTLKIMLDKSNVGQEVSVGEMTFPPNQESGEHTHGAIEMFYVISGEYTHIVNGKPYVLKPGMAGYVKLGDKVKHKTGPEGAKTVIIWVPGQEADRLAAIWKREP